MSPKCDYYWLSLVVEITSNFYYLLFFCIVINFYNYFILF